MTKPQQYRKKPVVIEALQLTPETFEDCIAFIETGDRGIGDGTSSDECHIGIVTLEGEMECRAGDFIIRGVQGEFYPCKPDIFEQTYEAV